MKSYLSSMTLLAFIAFVSFPGVAQGSTQEPSAPQRQESERAIRNTLYESALASFTGDIKLYRRHVAHRFLELNRLVFEGLREIPDGKEMLTENETDTADEFLDLMFVQGASRFVNLSRDEMAQRSRAQSNGSITFLGDREAILSFGGATLRIVYEDKEWKTDETEAQKELFLKNFPFTDETRAKIQKL
jgi:hypothetical protein